MTRLRSLQPPMQPLQGPGALVLCPWHPQCLVARNNADTKIVRSVDQTKVFLNDYRTGRYGCAYLQPRNTNVCWRTELFGGRDSVLHIRANRHSKSMTGCPAAARPGPRMPNLFP